MGVLIKGRVLNPAQQHTQATTTTIQVGAVASQAQHCPNGTPAAAIWITLCCQARGKGAAQAAAAAGDLRGGGCKAGGVGSRHAAAGPEARLNAAGP